MEQGKPGSEGAMLAHVALLVDDYDKAIAHYTGELGFELVEDRLIGAARRWVRVAAPGGGSSLLLAKAVGDEQRASIGRQGAGRVFLFLHTSNFRRDHAALLARGVEFEEAPREESYGIVAVFRDRYGNRWDLIEPRRPVLSVRRVDLESSLARELIAELNAELSARYPEPGATHFRLEARELVPGRGAFLVVEHMEGEQAMAVGCGAVRRLDDQTAELKRMYVRMDARGLGAGRLLLEALEEEARTLGVARIVLETGLRQHEALCLYERGGYHLIDRFAEYRDSPLSICLEKRLAES